MSNPIVDSIVSNLESGLIDSAKQAGVDLKPKVLENAKSFITTALPAIERWVVAYTQGNLKSDDLKTLIEDLLEDAIVHGLTLLEAAEIELDKTKNVLLSLVGGVASSAIGKALAV